MELWTLSATILASLAISAVAKPGFFSDLDTCATYGQTCAPSVGGGATPSRGKPCCPGSKLICQNAVCVCPGGDDLMGVKLKWINDRCFDPFQDFHSIFKAHMDEVEALFEELANDDKDGGFELPKPEVEGASAEKENEDRSFVVLPATKPPKSGLPDSTEDFEGGWIRVDLVPVGSPDSGGMSDYSDEARTAPIVGVAVFVAIIFLGTVFSVIYVRLKQETILKRRRNMAMAAAASGTILPGMEPTAPDLPPSYDDVVGAESGCPVPKVDEEDPPHYKSLTNIQTFV